MKVKHVAIEIIGSGGGFDRTYGASLFGDAV
jgi:hypothetical protein